MAKLLIKKSVIVKYAFKLLIIWKKSEIVKYAFIFHMVRPMINLPHYLGKLNHLANIFTFEMNY